jgi:hypothetical protein
MVVTLDGISVDAKAEQKEKAPMFVTPGGISIGCKASQSPSEELCAVVQRRFNGRGLRLDLLRPLPGLGHKHSTVFGNAPSFTAGEDFAQG